MFVLIYNRENIFVLGVKRALNANSKNNAGHAKLAPDKNFQTEKLLAVFQFNIKLEGDTMSKSSLTIISLLTLTVVGLAILLQLKPTTIEKEVDTGRIVYNICQKTRMSLTINEKECADASVKYKYEYICKDGNTSPENQYWAESNDQLDY